MRLSGSDNPDMGIVINSDLTISCNSDDMYANGRIGDLRTDTLASILHGKTATDLRRKLARGKLPLRECGNCPSLKRLRRRDIDHDQAPGPVNSILIENTASCNVHCLSCNRPAIESRRRSVSMNAADLDVVLREIAVLDLKEVRIFNLGEPFASANISDLIEGLRTAKPDSHLITSTNGTLLRGKQKIAAALLLDEVNVTLPGSSQGTVSRYQLGQRFEVAKENLRALCQQRDAIQARTIIIWKYLLFRWNDSDEEVGRAIALASELGVDILRFVVCVSPLQAMSLKYVFTSKLPPSVSAEVGHRHGLEVVGHRHIDVRFPRRHVAEQIGRLH